MDKKAMMAIVAKMCAYQSASCRGLDMADMARQLLDMASVPTNAVISEIPVSDYNQVVVYFYIPGDSNYYMLFAGDGIDGSKANFKLSVDGTLGNDGYVDFFDNPTKIDINYFKEEKDMANKGYFEMTMAVKPPVGDTRDANLITADHVECMVMAALEPWTVGDMDATEALIKVETLIDKMQRKYNFTARCMAHEINCIVSAHESSVLEAVQAGADRLVMPLAHIRLLAQHGIDMRVEGDKVYASDGYSWENVTDMSKRDLYSWLGY